MRVDILVPSKNGSRGAFVGARIDRGGCDAAAAKGIFFTVYANNGTFVVSSDLGKFWTNSWDLLLPAEIGIVHNFFFWGGDY